MKYRKKPVIIEAVQWNGDNIKEISSFINSRSFTFVSGEPYDALIIHTLEGNHNATVGDYIIKGIQGEFYPCKPDIFEKTYEKV